MVYVFNDFNNLHVYHPGNRFDFGFYTFNVLYTLVILLIKFDFTL